MVGIKEDLLVPQYPQIASRMPLGYQIPQTFKSFIENYIIFSYTLYTSSFVLLFIFYIIGV